ncbi:MAG TPA: D-tyrosyl-tRNA(Tyr) deacylase [Phycisphaerales bacterium]|nr:D-tyrosyl-tRNA(Tyr) deacylase [Phycisphaerales bacterium]
MRAVCQRVSSASVEIDGAVAGHIERGLLVYLGVGRDDTVRDAEFIADKIANLRIFEDDQGRMNRSVLDSGGGVLVVSNFTLYADARKGRRPAFDAAAGPDTAEPLYEQVCELLAARGLTVGRGVFGGYMRVAATNDGPVNILLDSSRLF